MINDQCPNTKIPCSPFLRMQPSSPALTLTLTLNPAEGAKNQRPMFNEKRNVIQKETFTSRGSSTERESFLLNDAAGECGG
jgi:hypothetical protein